MRGEGELRKARMAELACGATHRNSLPTMRREGESREARMAELACGAPHPNPLPAMRGEGELREARMAELACGAPHPNPLPAMRGEGEFSKARMAERVRCASTQPSPLDLARGRRIGGASSKGALSRHGFGHWIERDFPHCISYSLSPHRGERVGVRGVTFARKLRKSSTDAELRLWHRLRAGRLHGHKFRRQHPIGPYFADFACLAQRVVIELDGGQHADRKSHDDQRTAYLGAAGWRVIRFWDDEVLGETEAVLEQILESLSGAPLSHPSRRDAGEGDRRVR